MTKKRFRVFLFSKKYQKGAKDKIEMKKKTKLKLLKAKKLQSNCIFLPCRQTKNLRKSENPL